MFHCVELARLRLSFGFSFSCCDLAAVCLLRARSKELPQLSELAKFLNLFSQNKSTQRASLGLDLGLEAATATLSVAEQKQDELIGLKLRGRSHLAGW